MGSQEISEAPPSGKTIKRCWLHIGMHKTGSTTIQRTLASLPKSKKWDFLTYQGRPNLALALYSMFGEHPEKFHLWAKRGLTQEQIRKEGEVARRWFDFALRNGKAPLIIISSETMGVMTTEEIRRIHDFIAARVDEVKVFAYVRDPREFAVSWFQQSVKHGRGAIQFTQIVPHYRKRFKKFLDIFGSENVKYKLFTPTRLEGGCAVRDFCHETGIPLKKSFAVVRTNESLSQESCGLLYAYRKFGPGFGVGKAAVAENLALDRIFLRLPGRKFKFAKDLLNAAFETEKKDISWMEQQLGEKFSKAPPAPDGIRSEKDLLKISNATCLEFHRMFCERFGLDGSSIPLPQDDPVLPEQAAAMVQQCRELYANEYKRQATADNADQCLIHVGMHKTGTTSIQKTLAALPPNDKCHYVTLWNVPNAGKSMHAMFGENPASFHLHQKRGRSAKELREMGARLRQELTDQITANKGKTIIISSETISHMSKAEVTHLRDFLMPHFKKIKIVGYVRPPADFLASWFQQLVKHGTPGISMIGIKPRYKFRFKKFDDVFGKNNVTLKVFDPRSLHRSCAVSDFCKFTGIPIPATDDIVRANESLGREACGLLYAYRKYGSGYGVGDQAVKENALIIQAMINMGGEPFRYAPEFLLHCLERQMDDIQWMEKRLKMSLIDPPSDNPSGVHSDEDLLHITADTCRAFLEEFRKLSGKKVPDSLIPAAEIPAPAEVAAMIDSCRTRLSKHRFAPKRKTWHGRLRRRFSSHLGKYLPRFLKKFRTLSRKKRQIP